MRLDNKYFNLFVATCALLTLIVIIYGSISYSQKQEKTFRENIREFNSEDIYLSHVGSEDSLALSSLQGRPVLIHFWATWSDRSQGVQLLLSELKREGLDLVVVAVAVRDDPEMVARHVEDLSFDFVWVEGTNLYQVLQVPGVPSQILLDRNGTLVDVQVGDDQQRIRNLLEAIR